MCWSSNSELIETRSFSAPFGARNLMESKSYTQAGNSRPAESVQSRASSIALWKRLVIATVVVLAALIGGLALSRVILATGETTLDSQSSPDRNGVPGATPSAETRAGVALVISTPAPIAAAPSSTATGAVQAKEQPTSTPTLAADDVLVEVTPAPGAVGWVRSNDTRANHFGDSFVYAGISEDQIFHGALQFDLSQVPRGAPIRRVTLQLVGLDDERLDRVSNASWEVRWLDPEINDRWGRSSFQDIHNAPVLQSLFPPAGQADLQPGTANSFQFDQKQLAQLEKALVDQQSMIAIRLDGPEVGTQNLFAWDSGYGPETSGKQPKLSIVLGSPPQTPPSAPTVDFIVVTSTPTPENVLTALANVLSATAQASLTGTATPTPLNMVTATPTAENQSTAAALSGYWVVTPTPTPANGATETMIVLYTTAQALTTGTWTPTPAYFVTATPSATFVVITNTPTPRNASALLAWAIAEATRVARTGPPTPIPPGVITATPRWVAATSTSTPENQSTAQALRILATVAALTTGTYTPVPRNLVTPTPTPTSTELPLLSGLTPTPTRTPVPGAIPEFLRGKIVFYSDRLGSEQLFVMDGECAFRPSGCTDADVSLLRDPYPYELASPLDTQSSDGTMRAFVQLENQVINRRGDIEQVPRVMVENAAYDSISRLSPMEGAAYDPAWSPSDNRVAFVSTEPGNDEIYAINADGSDLRRLTSNHWEWDKHPTWSPDGKHILFYSNRETGRRQLWIMKADGSEQRNISNNQYNDWNPLWIK